MMQVFPGQGGGLQLQSIPQPQQMSLPQQQRFAPSPYNAGGVTGGQLGPSQQQQRFAPSPYQAGGFTQSTGYNPGGLRPLAGTARDLTGGGFQSNGGYAAGPPPQQVSQGGVHQNPLLNPQFPRTGVQDIRNQGLSMPAPYGYLTPPPPPQQQQAPRQNPLLAQNNTSTGYQAILQQGLPRPPMPNLSRPSNPLAGGGSIGGYRSQLPMGQAIRYTPPTPAPGGLLERGAIAGPAPLSLGGTQPANSLSNLPTRRV